MPLLPLFLLLVVLPVLELTILIRAGSLLGFWLVLGLVLGTGVAGAYLARSQGRKTIAAIRERWARGEVPAAELLDGAAILVGGTLLLTPGFLTDFAGLLLLLPPSRKWFRRALMGLGMARAGAVGSMAGAGGFRVWSWSVAPGASRGTPPAAIVDAQVVESVPLHPLDRDGGSR